jgi:tetratricopeptide (TPR) repeat protein
VSLNCAAIPEALLEAELFGVERGAFTGATQARSGLFQAADGGTLFLDEVGGLPLPGQAKLLTAVEEHLVRPLGGVQPRRVDTWVISATSEDLRRAIAGRRFREDLYHRLATIRLTLPALRERGADIVELAEHFLARACADFDSPAKTLGPDAREALLCYAWPGNVRELVNVMERVALLADGPVVTRAALTLCSPTPHAASADAGPTRLGQALKEFERGRIIEALEQARWNVVQAAALLRIPRTTLRRRMADYRLSRGDGPVPRSRRLAPGTKPVRTVPSGPGPRSPAPLPVQWERRAVTLLGVAVTDTRDGAGTGIGRVMQALAERVPTFGGHVVRIDPRRLVAAFGLTPGADAPIRALQAALAMQRATGQLAETLGRPRGVQSAVHIASAPVSRTPRGPELALDADHPAWGVLDDLLTAAEPSGILASADAAPFFARAFLTDAVPRRGRDALRAFRVRRRVAGTFPGPTGSLSRFVGRQHELDILEARLGTAAAGHGQMVGIIGEPGLGKSRLLLEFRHRLETIGARYVEGHCVASGQGTPYGALLDPVRVLCGLEPSARPEEIMERVRKQVVRLDLGGEPAVPCLLQLLGVPHRAERLAKLSAEALRFHTFEVLRQLWLRATLDDPLVLAIEDLHWIDPTSEAFLGTLVDSIPGSRLLICTTYRPGYRPPWMGRSHATQLALPRLSPEQSLALVHAVLRETDRGRRLAEALVPRAQGNPFFLEELVRAVDRESDKAAPSGVPETVEATILGRMQQLPAAEHHLLRTAAVLGPEVPIALLRRIRGESDELDQQLESLLGAEFLRARPGVAESTYVFAHALTQEVAYGQLGGPERLRLHEAAGRALEQLFAGRLDGVVDDLAHHYGLSANHEKAVAYLTRLADRAASGSATVEALAALDRALAHAEQLTGPEREQQIVTILARHALPMSMVGRTAECRDLLLRHWPRAERLGDPALSGPYCVGLAHILEHLGRGDEARPWAERALREAERCNDRVTQGKAHLNLSMNTFWKGHLAESADHGERAVTLLRPTTDTSSAGHACWFRGFSLIWLGRFADALMTGKEAREIGDRTGDARLQSYGDKIAGWAHACLGDIAQALGLLQRALHQAPDRLSALAIAGPLGFAQIEAGQPEAALESLEQGVAACRQIRVLSHYGSWIAVWLGDAHLAAGRPERARSLAEQAFVQAREVGFPQAQGLAQRLLGRLASAAGAHDEAADALHEAMRLFTAIEARYEIARTHLDLAPVARARGNPERATRHLAEARALFDALGVRRDAARAAELAMVPEFGTGAPRGAGAPPPAQPLAEGHPA